MNKLSIREFGVFLGNFIVFISIFLPWYSLNIYGTYETFSGLYIASSTLGLSIIYLLPLLSGILACGVILRLMNRDIYLPEKYALFFAIALSITIVAIVFAVLLMTPAGMPSYLINNLSIGGYAAITGGILSLIVLVFPTS